MKKMLFVLTGALTAASMLLVACGGGSDVDLQALATEAANTQPVSELTVVADDLEFDTDTIVVPADQEVSITLDNRDGGTLHNVAVYTYEDGERGDEVYRGELFDGEDTQTYTFPAPPAGVYLFRCDAHPEMEGAFIAR